MMNIVIFDEHPAILDSITNFFTKLENFHILGKFSNKPDLLRFLKHNEPNLIITEFLCDDELGFAWICQLRKLSPHAYIILFSSLTSTLEINHINDIGADAFVNKKSSISTLYNIAIDFSSNKNHLTRIKPATKYLTIKEKSIIKLMIQGLTSAEISEKVGCSIHTINNQKNHLIKKFGCNTSPELIAKLFRMGYLKL